MIEQIYRNPDIYKISVSLPENPLKILNSYVLHTREQDLIIDTGFNREECLRDLQNGLQELNVDLNKAIIFLTHLHSDHVGLVNQIITPQTKVMMSSLDYHYLEASMSGSIWDDMEKRFIKEGMPEELVIAQRLVNPARIYAPEQLFPCVQVSNHAIIQIGGYTLKAFLTTGHTPGHMCLYLENEGILFTGDHILFDITPNITMWQNVPDALGDYLTSLNQMKQLKVKIALPGHRSNNKNFYTRISEIEQHHEQRLKEILSILEASPQLTAYEIGAGMTWSMRGKNWNEFPIQQKWFALGETIAHLDFLYHRHQIYKVEKKGVIYYSNVTLH